MPENKLIQHLSYQKLLMCLRKEIRLGQEAVLREQAKTYWNVGRVIAIHLLENKDRANYGGELFIKLAKNLNVELSTLHQSVKFYQRYPKIVDARPQLSWSHYRKLITVENKTKRRRLEENVIRQKLTSRQLEEKIKTFGKTNKPLASVPQKITPLKGELYTYKVIELSAKGVCIDCGFEVDRDVSLKISEKIAAGDIIQSALNNGAYTLKPIDTTARALYTYRAVPKKIIDGDTFWVRIDVGFDTFVRQKLRLRGMDAPEIDTAKGVKAKSFVQKAFKDLEYILIRTSVSDKYDRYLADVFYGPEEKFLNQELLDNGLAKLWQR